MPARRRTPTAKKAEVNRRQATIEKRNRLDAQEDKETAPAAPKGILKSNKVSFVGEMSASPEVKEVVPSKQPYIIRINFSVFLDKILIHSEPEAIDLRNPNRVTIRDYIKVTVDALERYKARKLIQGHIRHPDSWIALYGSGRGQQRATILLAEGDRYWKKLEDAMLARNVRGNGIRPLIAIDAHYGLSFAPGEALAPKATSKSSSKHWIRQLRVKWKCTDQNCDNYEDICFHIPGAPSHYPIPRNEVIQWAKGIHQGTYDIQTIPDGLKKTLFNLKKEKGRLKTMEVKKKAKEEAKAEAKEAEAPQASNPPYSSTHQFQLPVNPYNFAAALMPSLMMPSYPPMPYNGNPAYFNFNNPGHIPSYWGPQRSFYGAPLGYLTPIPVDNMEVAWFEGNRRARENRLLDDMERRIKRRFRNEVADIETESEVELPPIRRQQQVKPTSNSSLIPDTIPIDIQLKSLQRYLKLKMGPNRHSSIDKIIAVGIRKEWDVERVKQLTEGDSDRNNLPWGTIEIIQQHISSFKAWYKQQQIKAKEPD